MSELDSWLMRSPARGVEVRPVNDGKRDADGNTVLRVRVTAIDGLTPRREVSWGYGDTIADALADLAYSLTRLGSYRVAPGTVIRGGKP